MSWRNKEDMKNTKDLSDIKLWKPLWDNIIVRPFKLDEKDQFKRPQGEEDKSELGEIISVGSGTSDVDITQWLQPGDTVLFNKYSSTPIDFGKEIVVRAEDVVAVLRK